MAALRSLSFCLLAVGLLLPAAYTEQRITAQAGQDVTLPCGAGKEKEITALEWSRADQKPDYVLLYRGGRFESDGQHPSFRNRVDLQDRQMRGGDVSLILKDVKIKDTGIYECKVIQKGGDLELICIIYLEVSPPPGQRIPAEAGQDSVTLPCGTGKETQIRAVEWSRPDLDPDVVFLYRDGHFESDYQHPSFRSRVDLQDRWMKDGDASLILKNVKINDTGTYLCGVYQGEGGLELMSSIHLEVSSPPGTQEGRDNQARGDKEGGGEEGGDKEGGVSLGLIVGLLVAVLLFLLFLLGVFLICRTKPSRRKLFSRQPLAKAPELVKEPLLPPSEPPAEPELEPEPEPPAEPELEPEPELVGKPPVEPEPEPELVVGPLLPPSEAPAAGSPR